MKPCLSWLQVSLIAVLATACNDPADLMPSTSGSDRDAVALFETAVQNTMIREPIYTSGTVIPDKITDLVPGVSGPVEVVHVEVGDRVTTGQPLMQVEQTEYRLNVRQLENSVALARAEFMDAKADLDTNLDLSRRGAVSREVLDNVRTRHDMARARLGIEEARLQQAIEALDDTVIKAPFDGIISRRNIDEGAWVQGRAGPAAPLQIIKIDRVRVKAWLPETALSRIEPGTPATVTIDGLDRSWDTQVDIINDLVDEQTRSIEIRMTIG
ncbi:MAG: efflux RND transporter periplasmic adaptor subunit, partial [Pseudomonadales bacterium]|nr:efflux RND transporter periplasmic adaptor subunit [Pseudomonadales bacterium]